MLRKKKRIVRRHENNPLLTGEDFPGDIVTVFNCGVVKQGPEKYTMVARTEDSALDRYLWVCDSTDGIHFTPRPQPAPVPHDDPIYQEYVEPGHGLSYHDPRVVELEGKFYVTHNCHTGYGCQIGLFEVDETFEKWDWKGLISLPDDRNAVLFPEKINGKYWRMDRPNVKGATDVWVQQSPDLIHWGVPRRIIGHKDTPWSYAKIGAGAPPIRTDEGWLCILHGVRIQCTDYVYGLGVALLDLDDPSKVIGVAQRCILAPEESYELMGQTLSVVFTCGAILEDDGMVTIHYGAADTVQCVGYASLEDLIHAAKNE